MAKKKTSRRIYDDEFKAEAVQMLLDGHSATSVAQRLGVSCPTTVRDKNLITRLENAKQKIG